MTQTHTMAIFTIHTDNLPAHFQEIIQHEQAVVEAWKSDGLLEHLFLRPSLNGAVLVFRNLSQKEAQAKMEQLPLFPYMKSVEYVELIKQF
jgi:muconolactone D-isomerase